MTKEECILEAQRYDRMVRFYAFCNNSPSTIDYWKQRAEEMRQKARELGEKETKK